MHFDKTATVNNVHKLTLPQMMEYGEHITAEDVTPADDNAQYMFLRERLKALKDG